MGGVQGEDSRRHLSMEDFGCRSLEKRHHRPPLRGVFEGRSGRDFDVPHFGPPLGEHGADSVREQVREGPIDVEFQPSFDSRVRGHPKGMARIWDKGTPQVSRLRRVLGVAALDVDS